MRAIIIDEDRFAEIADLMKAAAAEHKSRNEWEMLGITKEAWIRALDAAHSRIHYEFVRWAQSHGASCVRR